VLSPKLANAGDGAALNLLELERLHRIRNPSKYLGKP
jgi:hypothetical protein